MISHFSPSGTVTEKSRLESVNWHGCGRTHRVTLVPAVADSGQFAFESLAAAFSAVLSVLFALASKPLQRHRSSGYVKEVGRGSRRSRDSGATWLGYSPHFPLCATSLCNCPLQPARRWIGASKTITCKQNKAESWTVQACPPWEMRSNIAVRRGGLPSCTLLRRYNPSAHTLQVTHKQNFGWYRDTTGLAQVIQHVWVRQREN